MKTVLGALGLVAVAVTGLSAESLPADSLFDRLIGRRVLQGTIARRQTTHDVSFEWMLGREYVRMHEVSRERALHGGPAYEAVVLFGRDPRSGEYACLWMDLRVPRRSIPPESAVVRHRWPPPADGGRRNVGWCMSARVACS